MSWIDKLVQTYDLNAGSHGLIPLFHTEMNAQIIVSLDENANFVDAHVITNKKDRSVIIPCTEDSSARTSGACPHPLFDTLQYIAGDLCCAQYCIGLAEKRKNSFKDCFEMYLAQLDEWCHSEYANPYVCTVRNYLERKTLSGDLIQKGILPVDTDGAILFEKPKGDAVSDDIVKAPIYSAVTGELFKAFVLFEIYGKEHSVPLWNEPGVRESWQNYYFSKISKTAVTGFCQVSGKEVPLALLHPKRICNAGDNAKIISGNDNVNFTYRGRFETPQEALAISIETTQKAHSALRWILAKQGTHEGSQYMVAWAVDSDPEVPSPLKDTAELLSLEDELANLFESAEKSSQILPDTAPAEAESLNKLIAGYFAKLNAKGLCFIVLDAATPGTLAIKEFRDLDSSLYLKNIFHWHTECAWKQQFSKDKKFYGAPAPRDMVRAAYGEMKMDDPRIKNTVSRLLPCILDASPIPRDIADCVIRRVSRFESVEPWEFNKNLGIACSVYRYNNQQRRRYTMALDPSIHSRDYLYGRLLAVAECLEHSALTDSESKRPTNAMRLMAHFAEHPYSTWRNLEMSLNPYKVRLASNHPGYLAKYETLLEEIHQAFVPADFTNDRPLSGEYLLLTAGIMLILNDFTNDRPLSGEYLLGYYCQKADCFTKKENTNENND